ncbi:MAG: exo-alpha-sialidase [Deltaproteobacteria bacterium]|nr:exo-alpha-sialidase [Deltaproteobacteria bacterium]
MPIVKIDSKGKPRLWLKGFLLAILLTLFTCLFFVFSAVPSLKGFALPEYKYFSSSSDKPLFKTQFVSTGKTKSVHCATVVEISEGRLLAFWYGGTHERDKDTCIYSSVFDPQKCEWTSERTLITRKDTQQDLGRHIKFLGNPVVIKDEDSKLWLFYVSVSFGGWSGSSINLTTSSDEGKTWTPSRRLVTSPCLNLATLVKGAPFLFEDGTIGLPVYHEFIGKFGELLRLDREGNVIRKTRLSWGRDALQPVIVPITQESGVGFMRYSGKTLPRLLLVRTTDGGGTWSHPVKVDVPNPNAAVSSIRLESGAILLIHNNDGDLRCDMTLSYSEDNGSTWRVIYEFEKAEGEDCQDKSPGFSYPYIIRTQNGDFHLLYSWNSTHIKHVQFNLRWVKRKI